jgi:cell division transport system permease protein
MWIRSLRRFIAEAFSGMFKNGLMTIASLVVVTSCLIMLGIFLIVTLNVNSISDDIADSCQVKVYISEEAKQAGRTDEILQQIKKISYTKDVTFENGVDAFKEFKEGMTKEELAPFTGLPDDFLYDAYNVTVDDIENTGKITELLSSIDGVDSVENGEDVVSVINTFRNGVKNVSFWVILVFMLISIFIISNTVKLTLHNRRKEINIMKYVGATDSYIRWPFIIEGIVVGLVAAAIAFFITQFTYGALCNALSGDESIIKFLKLLSFKQIWMVFALSYAGLGAVIGALGSAFSIRKYLKV